MIHDASSRKPNARQALGIFINHMNDWGRYYEQARRSAEAALRTQQQLLGDMAEDDPTRFSLGQMYIRYLVCLEAYERIAGELIELAAIARAKVGTKPLSERQALTRLRMVIDLMSTGMLQFAQDQWAAQRDHLRAHSEAEGAEVPAEFRDAYLATRRSETSQRATAYEHVVTVVGPIVVQFSDMYPKVK